MRFIIRAGILLVCVLITALGYLESIPGRNASKSVLTLQPTVYTDARLLHAVSFGFTNIAADFMWLQAVQYIGKHSDIKAATHLYDYLDATTALDPYFVKPYLVALNLMSYAGNPDESIRLGLRGVRALPNHPDIPFYLGYNYYFYKQDYENAGKWFLYASELPGALKSAHVMASVNLQKVGRLDVAIAVLQEQHKAAETEAEQINLEHRMRRLEGMRPIYDALSKYKNDHANLEHVTIASLIDAGYLSEIPRDPIDPEQYEYYINPDTNEPDIRQQ